MGRFWINSQMEINRMNSSDFKAESHKPFLCSFYFLFIFNKVVKNIRTLKFLIFYDFKVVKSHIIFQVMIYSFSCVVQFMWSLSIYFTKNDKNCNISYDFNKNKCLQNIYNVIIKKFKYVKLYKFQSSSFTHFHIL